jgi:hypothetical protein
MVKGHTIQWSKDILYNGQIKKRQKEKRWLTQKTKD